MLVVGTDCRPVLSDGTQWSSQVTAGILVSVKMLGSWPEKEKVALRGEGYETATRTQGAGIQLTVEVVCLAFRQD